MYAKTPEEATAHAKAIREAADAVRDAVKAVNTATLQANMLGLHVDMTLIDHAGCNGPAQVLTSKVMMLL